MVYAQTEEETEKAEWESPMWTIPILEPIERTDVPDIQMLSAEEYESVEEEVQEQMEETEEPDHPMTVSSSGAQKKSQVVQKKTEEPGHPMTVSSNGVQKKLPVKVRPTLSPLRTVQQMRETKAKSSACPLVPSPRPPQRLAASAKQSLQRKKWEKVI